MDAYRSALSAYLDQPERTQQGLADAIGCTQASVNRWVNGLRFPDAATAREIDKRTEGAVPFSIWQEVATARLLGEAA